MSFEDLSTENILICAATVPEHQACGLTEEMGTQIGVIACEIFFLCSTTISPPRLATS